MNFVHILYRLIQVLINAAVEPTKKKLCEDSGLDSLINLLNMPQAKVQSLAAEIINSIEDGKNRFANLTYSFMHW